MKLMSDGDPAGASPGLPLEPKSRPRISALSEAASMLRLASAEGVLLRLSMLSILALPSNDRGVAVQLLEWSTSALKALELSRPEYTYCNGAQAQKLHQMDHKERTIKVCRCVEAEIAEAGTRGDLRRWAIVRCWSTRRRPQQGSQQAWR